MQQTDALLGRFLAGLAPLSPLAVWAHGSWPPGTTWRAAATST